MGNASATTAGEIHNADAVERRRPRPVDKKRATKRPKRRSNGQMRFRLTSVLHWTDRLVRGAVSAYDGFVELSDDDTAGVYLDVGLAYSEKGDYQEAEAALRKLLELQPDNEQGWIALSKVQVKLGTPDAALRSLRMLEALDRDSFELRVLLAEIHTELGRHEEAVAELCRAIEWQPDASEIHYRIGVSLDKLSRWDEAIRAFERAIEISPRTIDYHQSLGFAYESKDDRKKAIECFKRSVELERRERMADAF